LVSVLQLPEAVHVGGLSEALCGRCESKNGEIINAEALEQASEGRYEVVVEYLKGTKDKPRP